MPEEKQSPQSGRHRSQQPSMQFPSAVPLDESANANNVNVNAVDDQTVADPNQAPSAVQQLMRSQQQGLSGEFAAAMIADAVV